MSKRDPALQPSTRPSAQGHHPPATYSMDRSVDATTSYRVQLSSGEDTVDPSTWAGSVPVAYGIAPRVRIGRSRWFNLLWLLPIGFFAVDRRGRGG